MKIILDLDGVLSDFVQAFAYHHGVIKSIDGKYTWKEKGSYSLENLGIGEKDLWSNVDKNFWESMPVTQEGPFLLRLIRSYVEVEDIATITHFPYDQGMNLHQIGDYFIGKLKWLERNFPELVPNFYISGNKTFFANNDFILIDDHESNIDIFEKEGGIGILIPRVWNRLHHLEKYLIKHVSTKLKQIFERT